METKLGQAINSLGLDSKRFEQFASSLVWRVGRLSDEGPLTIRVGLASSVPLFNDLPKLRNATEAEIEEAMKEDDIRVEWVGRMP
ncbi:MAG: DUF3248 domain-containing protein [Trueperaceae bacterium]|nr:DUF3248 domain-containing protein [Trueperaceae bacterium]